MKIEIASKDDLWKAFSNEAQDVSRPGELALNFQSIRPVLEAFDFSEDDSKLYQLYIVRPLRPPKYMMRGGGSFTRAAVVPQSRLLAVGRAMSRYAAVMFPLRVEYLGNCKPDT